MFVSITVDLRVFMGRKGSDRRRGSFAWPASNATCDKHAQPVQGPRQRLRMQQASQSDFEAWSTSASVHCFTWGVMRWCH